MPDTHHQGEQDEEEDSSTREEDVDEEGSEEDNDSEEDDDDDDEEDGDDEAAEEGGESNERKDGGPSESSASAGTDEEEEVLEMSSELQVGEVVVHDFLGEVKVVKLQAENQHEHWLAKKTQVLLPKSSRKYSTAEQTRWVFTDSLHRLTPRERTGGTSSSTPTTTRPTVAIADTNGASVGLSPDEVEELLKNRANQGFARHKVPAAVAEAHIQRKRKTKRLKEAAKRGRHAKLGQRVTKEPKVSPAQRIAEFPDHSLRESNNALFCDACVATLSLRKCSVKQHCKGIYHVQQLQKWNNSALDRQATIDLISTERNKNSDERGGCLPMFVQEFRCATVESLMRCGIAITKLDDGLGRLLSRVGAKVVDSSDMRMYIPLVRQKELDKIKDEVAHESLCLIFDGTTRVGEALAVVVRYCTSHFEIKYRLIALSTAAKHMTGAELCGMLLRILVKRVGESALDLVLSAARDSCATNGAALRSLKLCAMPNVMDVMCFSHTLHNCAKHMDLEVLESWLTPWLQLMAHSHRAKCVWRDETGEPPVLFSKVRWWSRMECASQIARHFHCLDNFVNIIERENVGDATTTALGNMLRSQVSRNALQVDLAIVLDASIFCEKTYRLEGDRLESLLLVEDIEAIREKGRHVGSTFDSLPNVAAVLRSQTQLKVGTPVYDWFGAPYNKFFDGVVKSLPSLRLGNTTNEWDGDQLR